MKSVSRRILIIVQNLPVPFDRRVWLEATTLTKNGYSVSVICPKAKGFNKSHEVLEGIHIYRYGLPIDAQGALGYLVEFLYCWLATAFLSLKIAFSGPGFDVIQACNPPDTYWLLALLWRPFGKKFVFDHHDLSPEMYGAKFEKSGGFIYNALLWLERRSFRAADLVITTNESHKRIAQDRGGKRAGEVYVVRSGPDLSRFRVYPKDPGYARGRPHLLVYLGEMCKQDGVDHLVRAVKHLRDECGRRDFFCLFVGGGPHQPAIEQYASEQGIMDVAAFTGRVSDEELCRILSSATLGIDPDPKNSWSDKSTMNKVIEYMYFGLPVVAYDLHETRVSAGAAGVYAAPNQEVELAKAVSLLLDRQEAREWMGDVGRKRVRDSLAWDHSVPVLLAAYDRMFGGAPEVVAAAADEARVA
ncbi:MAG: glycosyltransferase family 4 protein [Alphaproteobacteria bacterium]